MGYPVLLNLNNKVCVVVGGGQVASRKIRDLLAAGADVTVISPVLTPDLQSEGLHWLAQPYQPGMLARLRPVLVFAATDSAAVNQQVVAEAGQVGAWVNCADDPEAGDFASMPAVQRPPLTIAISTGGASPALAKRLLNILDACIGDEYVILAQWLGEMRQQVKATIPTQKERHQLYERIIESELLTHLKNQQPDTARQLFDNLIQEAYD